MARLLRCRFWKSEPWRGPPGCSPPASSSSASILMTLAPQSASCRTQVGLARTRVRSSTVKRDKACEARGTAIRENSETVEGKNRRLSDARGAEPVFSVRIAIVQQEIAVRAIEPAAIADHLGIPPRGRDVDHGKAVA